MKKISIGSKVFEPLTQGIEAMSPIIRALYGPGRKLVFSRLGGKPVAASYFTGVMDAMSVSDPMQDVGVKLFRDVINQVREKSGTGAGIAAILAVALMQAGRKLITGGMSQRELTGRLEFIREEFNKFLLARATAVASLLPGQEQDAYRGVAETVTGDVEISSLMSDVFSHVGLYGNVEMRRGHSTKHEAEYVNGYTFKTSTLAYKMLKGAKKADLANPIVYVTDCSVAYNQALLDILVDANKQGRPLLFICDSIDSAAVEVILHNIHTGALTALAVRPPSVGYDRSLALQDLAQLSGAEYVDKANPLAKLSVGKGGAVSSAVFNGTTITLIHDGLRITDEYIAKASRDLDDSADFMTQKKIKERLGNIRGKSAIVTIGGTSETVRDEAYYRAECAAHAIRGAMQKGFVAGGCQVFFDFAKSLPAGSIPDSLRMAMCSPFYAVLGDRWLSRPISDFVSASPTSGYDYRADAVLPILASRLVDSAAALSVASDSALSIAKTVLSSGAVVVEV